VASMIAEYLQHKEVIRKKHLQETFLASRTVFLELRQTPVAMPARDSIMNGTLSYAILKAEFDAISERYDQLQKARREAREAER
ncbi:hypothetical protein BGZ72_003022, partial [Mortierella alpina]